MSGPDTEEDSLSRLVHVAHSENFERLVDLSLEHLQVFPNSVRGHDHCAVGYLRTKQTELAWNHIRFLLGNAPDYARSHQLACCYYLARDNGKKALHHANVALGMEPESDYSHYLQAHSAVMKGSLEEAQAAIDESLKADPNSTDYINLKVYIDSLSDTSATGAWKRLDTLTDALALDPENADLHISIGETWLFHLENPERAEAAFRTALAIDPKCQSAQRLLFEAIGKRSYLYRLLSLPANGWLFAKAMLQVFAEKPWQIIIFLLLWKLPALFLAWLLIVTAIFWVPSKFHKWLILSDIHRTARASGPAFWQSKAVRWILFCLALSGFWFGLFQLCGIPVQGGFIFLGIFASIHAIIIVAITITKRHGVARAKPPAPSSPHAMAGIPST